MSKKLFNFDYYEFLEEQKLPCGKEKLKFPIIKSERKARRRKRNEKGNINIQALLEKMCRRLTVMMGRVKFFLGILPFTNFLSQPFFT